MRYNLVLIMFLTTEFPVSTFSEGLGTYDLNILHHNDFHANYEETTPQSTTCHPNVTCIGGFPRLYTAVNLLRDNNTLLLNAGDTFQGTVWHSNFKWNLTQKVMNLLPHDAHTLGNHEFDDGVESLAQYMKALAAPIVAANMNVTNEPMMKNLFKKSIVLIKNGRKIGIIGVVLASLQTISAIGNLTFSDEVETVSKEAERLAKEGVNIIIVLSHVGFPIDLEIAKRGSPHIDVIVGGHSHYLFYNGEPKYNLKADHEYPVVVERDSGDRILIVQSMSNCRFLGHLKLKFDKRGKLLTYSGNSVLLDATIEQDPNMLEILEPYKTELKTLYQDDIIGESEAFLDYDSCVKAECQAGNLVCDAYSTMYPGTKHRRICILSAGTIRSPLPSGSITTMDLKTLLPFGNRVATFELIGAHLLNALEYSISKWNFDLGLDARLLQVSGLRVVYNISKPINSRVSSVDVICQTCDEETFEPMNSTKTYEIVGSSYMTSGGDGFGGIRKNVKNLKILEKDVEAVGEYIRRNSPVSSILDGRINIV